MDKLINRDAHEQQPAGFHKYATYAAQQLPFIWAAEPVRHPGRVHTSCTTSPSTRCYTLLPEYWYFTK